jgi:hypothetical protein
MRVDEEEPTLGGLWVRPVGDCTSLKDRHWVASRNELKCQTELINSIDELHRATRQERRLWRRQSLVNTAP